jgi:hypothetical protein
VKPALVDPDAAAVYGPRLTFERLRRLALARFPAHAETLENFLRPVRREMVVCADTSAPAGGKDELDAALVRLEDYLEALLVGEGVPGGDPSAARAGTRRS